MMVLRLERAFISLLSNPQAIKLLKIILSVAAISSALAFSYDFVIHPLFFETSSKEFADFQVYYLTARRVSRGLSPYVNLNAQYATSSISYIYLPLLAWLMQPIAHFSILVAARIWLCIEVVGAISAITLIVRVILPSNWPRIQLAVLATCLYYPSTINLQLGQINPLVLFLLAIALWAYINDHEILCGSVLGIGAGIKLAPFILGLLFIRRRWWLGLSALFCITLAWVAVGVMVMSANSLHEYVLSIIPVLGKESGWVYNQSWNGVINRLVDHSVFNFDADILWIRVLTIGLSIGGFIFAALLVRPAVSSNIERGAEFGIAIVAMLLGSTISWYNYDVFLLITLFSAAVICTNWVVSTRLHLALGITLFVIAVLMPIVDGLAPSPADLHIANGLVWWLYLQLWNLPALAMVWLMYELHQGAVAMRNLTT